MYQIFERVSEVTVSMFLSDSNCAQLELAIFFLTRIRGGNDGDGRQDFACVRCAVRRSPHAHKEP